MVCNRLQQSTKVTLQWYRPCRPFLWSAHNMFSSFNNVYSSSVSSDQKNQNRTFTKLIQVVNIVHLSLSAVFVRPTKDDRRCIFCSSYWVMLSVFFVCSFFLLNCCLQRKVSPHFSVSFSPQDTTWRRACSLFRRPVGSGGQTEHETDDDKQLFSYDSKDCDLVNLSFNIQTRFHFIMPSRTSGLYLVL